jgi:hypothetical protein
VQIDIKTAFKMAMPSIKFLDVLKVQLIPIGKRESGGDDIMVADFGGGTNTDKKKDLLGSGYTTLEGKKVRPISLSSKAPITVCKRTKEECRSVFIPKGYECIINGKNASGKFVVFEKDNRVLVMGRKTFGRMYSIKPSERITKAHEIRVKREEAKKAAGGEKQETIIAVGRKMLEGAIVAFICKGKKSGTKEYDMRDISRLASGGFIKNLVVDGQSIKGNGIKLKDLKEYK